MRGARLRLGFDHVLEVPPNMGKAACMHQTLRTSDDVTGLVTIGEKRPPEVGEQTPGYFGTT